MILITGANGNLGRRLIGALAGRVPVRAVVRSERAAGTLEGSPGNPDVRIVDYLDQAAMSAAAQGCSHIVHLVGIIKESAASTFEAAHEGTSRVVAEAAAEAGVANVVYLSILGASPDSANACLASKGRAEAILMNGSTPALILRVPMVLGEGDYAARALARRARQAFGVTFRAASLEQPIYAGDVVEAICAALRGAVPGSAIVDLAGPESLTRRALTARAAAQLGRRSRLISLPIGVGLALAGLFERLGPNPPVTRAMLGVLDHDDRIDPQPAADRLGIRLTPLDVMLERILRSGSAA